MKLLERLSAHAAVAGPERTYLAAERAHCQGDSAGAQKLIGQCLDRLPGHKRFREAARRFQT